MSGKQLNIVCSHVDMMWVFRWLPLGFSYQVCCDTASAPLFSLPLERQCTRVIKSLSIYSSSDSSGGLILLPPAWEILFALCSVSDSSLQFLSSKDQWSVLKVYAAYTASWCSVLPVYQRYLQQIFADSRVWKIALYGERGDLAWAQQALQTYASARYTPTTSQQSRSSFHRPFAWWSFSTPLWSQYSMYLSHTHPHVRSSVRHSLLGAKDADVDTLLPLSYSYFLYDSLCKKSTSSRCNVWDSNLFSTILAELLLAHANKIDWHASSSHIDEVRVYCTWSSDAIRSQPYLMSLLRCWKQRPIEWLSY